MAAACAPMEQLIHLGERVASTSLMLNGLRSLGHMMVHVFSAASRSLIGRHFVIRTCYRVQREDFVWSNLYGGITHERDR
jgi:hypothetical protein